MRAALIQAKASMNRSENWDRAEEMLKDAAAQGAKVACLQECFATWFFAQRMDPKSQELAEPIDGPTVTRMRHVAKGLGLILVVPFYERAMAGRTVQYRSRGGCGGRHPGHLPKTSHSYERLVQ